MMKHKMKHKSGFLCAGFLCAAIVSAALPASVAANNASRLLADKGITAIERRAYEKARGFCEQAVVADPSDALAFVCLAQAHEKKDAPKTAGKYYGIALSIAPDNEDALLGSGMADLDGGDLDAAQEKRDRLKHICADDCRSYKRLNSLIKRFVAKRARENREDQ